jgi:hypothetical protein
MAIALEEEQEKTASLESQLQLKEKAIQRSQIVQSNAAQESTNRIKEKDQQIQSLEKKFAERKNDCMHLLLNFLLFIQPFSLILYCLLTIS